MSKFSQLNHAGYQKKMDQIFKKMHVQHLDQHYQIYNRILIRLNLVIDTSQALLNAIIKTIINISMIIQWSVNDHLITPSSKDDNRWRRLRKSNVAERKGVRIKGVDVEDEGVGYWTRIALPSLSLCLCL